jgi:Na+-transporting methylmalonyl-CoA/oxaloacetate decarboxylase gamma subunit
MTQQLSLALQITAIGMGLVFAALVFLQVFMTLLVRFTSENPANSEQTDAAEDKDLAKQAAVIAVSIALAEEEENKPKEFPLPPTALVSAWQLARRASILNKRGPTR